MAILDILHFFTSLITENELFGGKFFAIKSEILCTLSILKYARWFLWSFDDGIWGAF
jgi:hypothetical protein